MIMKKWIEILLFFSILMFLYSCSSKEGPKLNLCTAIFDFGKIKRDSIYQGKVLIINSGNDTLKVTNLEPDCACTSVIISKNRIPPNDSCSLIFDYVTHNKVGSQENYICLITNTDQMVHFLQINAYVD